MHICYMRMLLHAHISEMSSYQQFQFQLIPTLSPIPYCLQVPSSLVRSWAIHINTFIHLFNANTHLKLFSELLCQYHYEKHTKIFQIFFFLPFSHTFCLRLSICSKIVPLFLGFFSPSSPLHCGCFTHLKCNWVHSFYFAFSFRVFPTFTFY